MKFNLFWFSVKILCTTFVFIGICDASNTRLTHGKLRLAAMIEGRPAFQQVIWQFSYHHAPEKIIKILGRHSAVIELKPGEYRVKLIFAGKTYVRNISIRSSTSQQLVIEAGNKGSGLARRFCDLNC